MENATKVEGTSSGTSALDDGLCVGLNRCDICGRFIGIDDIASGAAKRVLITPDSDFSTEDYETYCKTHNVEFRPTHAALSREVAPGTEG